jgi:hypothetical protein
VDDDDFTATLLASLPPSYVHVCTSINSSACLGAINLTPTIAKEIVLEEYHRWVTGDPKNEAHDEAFNADYQKRKKRDVECYNCHKRGHVKSECWAKGGGQEGQGPKRKGHGKEGAAAAADPQLEAWAALEEVIEDEDGQDFVAAAGGARANNGVETELYDSGASCHMSPFRDHFVSYRSIPPRPITAADK